MTVTVIAVLVYEVVPIAVFSSTLPTYGFAAKGTSTAKARPTAANSKSRKRRQQPQTNARSRNLTRAFVIVFWPFRFRALTYPLDIREQPSSLRITKASNA